LTKAEKKIPWTGLFEEEEGAEGEEGAEEGAEEGEGGGEKRNSKESDERGEKKMDAFGERLRENGKAPDSIFGEFQQLCADSSPADTPVNRIALAKFILLAALGGFIGALVLSSFFWVFFGGIAFWSAAMILLTLLGGHGIKNARENNSMKSQMELVFATYGLAAGAGVATCLTICLSKYFFLAIILHVALFSWATSAYMQPMGKLLQAANAAGTMSAAKKTS
jgi:hypothetical protein